MAHDVFVSYSSIDKATADAACAKLEGCGVRCWIAPRDILPGDDWSEAIVRAIESSRIMVLVFSAHANRSEQVKREIDRAVSSALTIISFRIEDVPMSKSLQFYIGTRHWLDALTPPLERHLDHLAETVRLLLSRDNPDEIPESLLKLTRQAEQGDVDAMVNLGLEYTTGRAVAIDYAVSTRWFRKAAELGDPMSMNNYGRALQMGHGVERDPAEGARWLEKAAAKGEALAMTNLGLAYENGCGVERDPAKAMKLYRQAVEKDETYAMNNLAAMYLDGCGVAVDIALARELFQRGARLGNATCMYNMGRIYDYGQGCERDEVEAVNWYRRAASKGETLAKDRLRALGYDA